MKCGIQFKKAVGFKQYLSGIINILEGITSSDLSIYSQDAGQTNTYSVSGGNIVGYCNRNGGANASKGVRINIRPLIKINPNVQRYFKHRAYGTRAPYADNPAYYLLGDDGNSVQIFGDSYQGGSAVTSFDISGTIDLSTKGLTNQNYRLIIAYATWGVYADYPTNITYSKLEFSPIP